MDPITAIWIASLAVSMAFGTNPEPVPPTQGLRGLSDVDLWERIWNEGDPLGDMTFAEAVAEDPRRVEGLILQRVVLQFYRAINRLQEPHVEADVLDETVRRSWLEQVERRRTDNAPSASRIASDFEAGWRAQSTLLDAALGLDHPEVDLLYDIVRHQQLAIRRAFREAREIADRARDVAPSERCRMAWARIGAVIENMADFLNRMLAAPRAPRKAGETITSDLPEISATSFGALDPDDLFGAYEWEQYVASGHRAPAVGLPQWRRSGGRFFA